MKFIGIWPYITANLDRSIIFIEHAIRSWPESTQGSPIVRVRWSRSRPSLFYVLDTKSHLYIW